MAEARRPRIYSIAPHRGFGDALADGLIARYGNSGRGLADGIILVPNNRAMRAMTEAFVRRAEGGGLLLPRMVAIGDVELDESLGHALMPLGDDAAIPPVVDPLRRRFALARLARARFAEGGAAEALRLADTVAGTLDQLMVEELTLDDLAALPIPSDLSAHWARAYDRLIAIAWDWQATLADWGQVDAADRRNRLLRLVAERWRVAPPAEFVVAAGITTAAPAVARLLRVVAECPGGMVVLPNFDALMPEEEWALLAPRRRDDPPGRVPLETHPHYHLRLLIERMGIARDEIMRWPRSGPGAAPPRRSRTIANIFAPPRATARWVDLPSGERSLAGVRVMVARDSDEEARAVAILVREAMEQPGRRVAIITPNRTLARRIAAKLARWDIVAEDSAGVPLTERAPGTLLLALLRARASDYGPVALMTLLKHPLVGAGDGRLAWIEGVRLIDLGLRGPRPAPGLDGIGRALVAQRVPDEAMTVWATAAAILARFDAAVGTTLAGAAGAIRDALHDLSAGAVWGGEAGRALARLFDMLVTVTDAPDPNGAADLAAMMEALVRPVVIRPPYGGHPRVAIYGLLEARLQQADLVICAGLNEGHWPQLASSDPWLAPAIRRLLGLPALERQIGLAAHDLAGALGAPEVVLTRAEREGHAPAVASRFLLRLMAMAGSGLARETHALTLARALDDAGVPQPAPRPAPRPPAAARRVDVAITAVDRLKADPYAFYAGRILRLRRLDPLDAEPSPAWRGIEVHRVLEAWAKEDRCDPARLVARAEALLAVDAIHPLIRALWRGRLVAAMHWIAAYSATLNAQGRRPVAIEARGVIDLGGVRLKGTADRVDRLSDGTLAIVDYKTGQPPSKAAVRAGFALQLGLVGALAEAGALTDLNGTQLLGQASRFEYWSLGRSDGGFGYTDSPVDGRGGVTADTFVANALAHVRAAIDRWILGDAPFTARLHPDYAPYGDYDQLMRLDEWYGRMDPAA